ncbi:tetracycline resistance monooxygenase [Flexibacter flexilis DSM 6793]|uniref:Flavin-dependent monooxygenase n=1 Tax=Flexibacter flexilis DSM 6793 TaxID=927664 RepID=A0A1I1HV84_9BACT|nr:NAD(P)/FAD-dependent oxidoreductase [Flexibacter flexilis]SFC27977.1 tetracycline resistance monooxygenase [Flexibacter flexilis DSM 6793]
MLLDNKKVAIIGAGPVGLTMARLLQQKGVAVSVHERDRNDTARIWGGTLDLHPATGQHAMQQAGLLAQYFALAKPMGRIITDEQGNVLAQKNPAFDNPEINRNQLRTLLLQSLNAGTVIWDKHLTALEAHGGQWLLQFADQSTATADLVIGANGGMSGIRKYITDTQVEATGTQIIQGEVVLPAMRCPTFYQKCAGQILMTTHNGYSLVANPQNNGILTYSIMFAATQSPAHWENPENISAFLAQKLGHWGSIFQELFGATSAFWALPTRKLPLAQAWKNNRPIPLTLIGDAAHLMPPFAGQGVNTGLMDAVLLTENLSNGQFETIETAIAHYEQQMFVYASQAQEASAHNEIQIRQPDFSFIQIIQ